MVGNESPIAVFDSGLGGISVLRELYKIMPNENYIYFGDSKNAPYGTKTLDEVRKLTFASVELLMKKGAKAFVVACNTATSAAVAALRREYPDVPFVGIEPAIKPASLDSEHPKVVVMATPLTLKQEKFNKLTNLYKDRANIIPLPCPGLMEYVEAGKLNSPELVDYLKNILSYYIDSDVNSIVLGCTHYPFVKPIIKQLMGENVKIFDGGNGTARETKHQLEQRGLENKSSEKGSVQFFNSLGTDEVLELSKKLFEMKLEE
jgi:glutamate racemase